MRKEKIELAVSQNIANDFNTMDLKKRNSVISSLRSFLARDSCKCGVDSLLDVVSAFNKFNLLKFLGGNVEFVSRVGDSGGVAKTEFFLQQAGVLEFSFPLTPPRSPEHGSRRDNQASVDALKASLSSRGVADARSGVSSGDAVDAEAKEMLVFNNYN